MSQKQPHEAKCGAKKKGGGTCSQKPLQNGRCHYHGGKTPSGIASPQFKTGLHSKYLTAIPSRLSSDYQDIRHREDLLELSDEVALIDTRATDLLKRVEQDGNGAPDVAWLLLQKTFDEYQKAVAEGAAGVAKAHAALNELEEIIEKGVSDALAWREVYGLLEQRRKLVESERKRAVEQQEMLTSKEAMLLFNALLSVVNEHVTDRDTKARIQTGFIRLVGSNDSRALRATG